MEGEPEPRRRSRRAQQGRQNEHAAQAVGQLQGRGRRSDDKREDQQTADGLEGKGHHQPHENQAGVADFTDRNAGGQRRLFLADDGLDFFEKYKDEGKEQQGRAAHKRQIKAGYGEQAAPDQAQALGPRAGQQAQGQHGQAHDHGKDHAHGRIQTEAGTLGQRTHG